MLFHFGRHSVSAGYDRLSRQGVFASWGNAVAAPTAGSAHCIEARGVKLPLPLKRFLDPKNVNTLCGRHAFQKGFDFL